MNDEAAKLAENDPTLLANRGELLQRARDTLLSSGSYQFKKGKSRSKQVDGNSVAGSSGSKRAKVDKEARRARMKEVEENICDIDEEISFKEKRRSQAETVRDYRQCDEITERLTSLKEKKRLLSRELDLLNKKEVKSRWYQKNKSRKHYSGTTSDATDVSCSSSSTHDLPQSSHNNSKCSSPSLSAEVIDLCESQEMEQDKSSSREQLQTIDAGKEYAGKEDAEQEDAIQEDAEQEDAEQEDAEQEDEDGEQEDGSNSEESHQDFCDGLLSKSNKSVATGGH